MKAILLSSPLQCQLCDPQLTAQPVKENVFYILVFWLPLNAVFVLMFSYLLLTVSDISVGIALFKRVVHIPG